MDNNKSYNKTSLNPEVLLLVDLLSAMAYYANNESFQPCLPQEIASILSRCRFVVPRTELTVPLIQYILRKPDNCHEHNSPGLSWPLNSILTIRGMAGIGKTTIAAAIVSSLEIQQAYNLVCFINLGDHFIANGRVNNITYSKFENSVV